jgi:phosphoglycolate phosphatase-like HAD superfamily hydrolase
VARHRANRGAPGGDGRGAPAEAIRALSVADAYDRLAAMDGVDLTVDAATFDSLCADHATDMYRNRARLLPDYHDLLGAIRCEGVAVGLVSASRREWVEMVLARTSVTRTMSWSRPRTSTGPRNPNRTSTSR